MYQICKKTFRDKAEFEIRVINFEYFHIFSKIYFEEFA